MSDRNTFLYLTFIPNLCASIPEYITQNVSFMPLIFIGCYIILFTFSTTQYRQPFINSNFYFALDKGKKFFLKHRNVSEPCGLHINVFFSVHIHYMIMKHINHQIIISTPIKRDCIGTMMALLAAHYRYF
jgi:hypothetical protein